MDKDGKPLQPVVHVWDSESLLKLQEIGLGAFERGVGALAFSVADQGAFLCVVDDSNEHMLSVWDCSRGTKLAEIKSTNDSVLAVGFSPRDSSCIVTSGKSHVHFWNWSGGAGVPGNGALTRKQGVFGVRCGCVQGGQGGQSGDGSIGLRTLMLSNSQLSHDFWFLLFPLLSACFSPGGGASQIARPQAGVGPKRPTGLWPRPMLTKVPFSPCVSGGMGPC